MAEVAGRWHCGLTGAGAVVRTGLGFNHSFIEGPQLGAALLATHLNGQPRIGASRGTPGASWAILVNHLFNTEW
ncbi:MAG TPA: hypothetical protein VIZ70_05175 [Propionibacteriaceae bacterium]